MKVFIFQCMYISMIYICIASKRFIAIKMIILKNSEFFFDAMFAYASKFFFQIPLPKFMGKFKQTDLNI